MDKKEVIESLEAKKKEWAKNNDELVTHTLSYKPSNDPDYIKDFKDKLVKLGDELNDIGKEYQVEVKKKAHEIANGYEDNPIVQQLIKEIVSGMELTGSISSGSREDRLLLLYDFIEILKNRP
jgi:hypothetical protein